ncbi:MAG: hypothetical protein HQM16_16810, partial [Deltaproteobacteria bacterium]|nr:hypothetical protein [Deltaproteobacteria bacterium]
MADYLDMVRGVTTSGTTSQISGERLSTTEVFRAVHQKGGAEFTTTPSYRQFQSSMMAVLGESGFTASQAVQLTEIGNIQTAQFVRVVLIAQLFAENREFFQRLINTVRNIVTQGKNIQWGLKSYLDGLERILGLQTQKLFKEIRARGNDAETLKEQTLAGKAQPEAEKDLYKEINQQLGQSIMNRASQTLDRDLKTMIKMTVDSKIMDRVQIADTTLAALKSYNDFADASIKEFPQRYHIDLYAYGQFAQRGVSLENYIRLASEVSPSRLLNLFAAAERAGQNPSAIIASLLATQASGGSVKDAVLNLENRFRINVDLLKAQPGTGRFVPVTANEVTLKQGDDVSLHFLALDGKDGVVSSEKSGFVLFPQKYEYTGSVLNLAFLPVGVYTVMAMGYDKDNNLLNYWMKVIVEGSIKKDIEKSFEEFKKIEREKQKSGQNRQQNTQNKQQGAEDRGEEGEKAKAKAKAKDNDADQDGVVSHFEKHPPNFKGPYLGEIVLPFDSLEKQADDLVVVAPPSGLVIDHEELCEGRFSSNAVLFRFLANHIETPEIIKRHGLLHISQSKTFMLFTEGLKKFVLNPGEQLTSWEKTLREFFAALKLLFPGGETTFDLAHQFFVRESQGFASGTGQGEIFSSESLEKREDRVMQAFYARGAYALAHAGDVSGALSGMSFASLMDLSDHNSQSVLGEYLEDIKNRYFSRQTDVKAQHLFGLHLTRNLGQNLSGNPHYQPQGKAFISSLNLDISMPGTD